MVRPFSTTLPILLSVGDTGGHGELADNVHANMEELASLGNSIVILNSSLYAMIRTWISHDPTTKHQR